VRRPRSPAARTIPAQRKRRRLSIEDPDVVAPVALARAFPAWNPRTAAERTGGYEGLLRIVIDEVGGVETAALINPVFPSYDRLLLDAARNWRFRPATKDGKPVKYRLTLPIVLSASGAR
jgi:TonB family protein